MIRKELLTILIILGVFIHPLFGQTIGDVRGRLSEKTTFEPTRISVEDTRYVGLNYITNTDSVIMKNCSIILRRDLDFSPYFEIVLFDEFFMRHMELTRMTVKAWRWLGSAYLLKLEAEFPGDNIRLRYRLIATETDKEIKKGKFETQKKYYRAMVHEATDEIVKFLTGDPGIFRTKVAYIKQTGETKELFTADYDGNNEHQLTNNKSINISPSFSPDGQYIFFTSYVADDPNLYMLNLRTNEVDLIADYPGINAAPSISPDGRTIACVLSKDGNSEIYLLDRKGKIKKRLTRSWAIESAPTWSPNGKEIAFTSDRSGSPQIYVTDIEGLAVRRLTYIGKYNDSPCWSPKGDRIAYVSRTGRFSICSISITGKDFQILATLGDNENPRFSPDGNHIVFSSNRLGSKEIYTMDLFGNNQRRLTIHGGYSNPAWSPFRK